MTSDQGIKFKPQKVNVTYCEPRSAELFLVSACPVLCTFNRFTLVHGLHVLILSMKSNFHETPAAEKNRPQFIRVAAEYFSAGQLIVSASCAVPINLPYIQSGN